MEVGLPKMELRVLVISDPREEDSEEAEEEVDTER